MARLIAILAPIVLLMACARSPEPDPWRFYETPAPDEIPLATDAEMIHALDAWHRYDMPSPPAGAELVWITGSDDSGFFGPHGGYAFLVGHADSGKLHLHDGTHEYEHTRGYGSIETVEAALPEQLGTFGSSGEVPLARYPKLFPLALHAYERGHLELGRQLVTSLLHSNFEIVRESYRQPNGRRVHDLLGVVVWGYWFNRAMEGGTDRHAIHTRLARAVDEFASLTSRRERLGQLGAAVAPIHVEPGSPQELVEALLDVPFRLPTTILPFLQVNNDNPLPEPLKAVLRGGFDVVPALLEYIDDNRLSRSIQFPSVNVGPFAITMGRLVRIVLNMIADWRVQHDGMYLPYSPQAWVGPPEDWWAQASHLDEEEYFASLLSPERLRERWRVESAYDPLAVALVLGHKYPDTLQRCIEVLLATEHPDRADRLLGVIPDSNLSTGQKAELLEIAILTLDRSGSSSAASRLPWLHEADPHAFVRVYVEVADSTERGLDGNCYFGRRIVSLGRAAQLSDDAEVWDALKRLTRRSVPDLQVRILNVMQADTRSAIAFLADFVEEEEPSEDQPARAAGERLAEILELSPPGNLPWPEFYATLKPALAHHGIQLGGQ